MAQQFHYDSQIRRFIAQFIRAVSNFQVEFGKDRNGITTLQTVPVIYGDMSRQAATILRNNSESTAPAVPCMAAYIGAIRYDQDRIQEPYHVSKMQLRQKTYDPDTGEYGTGQDSAYTVERLMPVPYTLTLKLDIWTSNTDQKLQLLEQMVTLFNPALEIQSTDNYIDWGSLTTLRLTDINWTSRSVPVGTEEPIDIATLTFELPIWISAPAKVKRLGVVQKIIASIFDANGNLDENALLEGNLMGRRMLAPLGYGVLYIGNTLTLVKRSEIVGAESTEKIGTPDYWSNLIDIYGSIAPGISEIRLQTYVEYDETTGTTTRNEVVGTIAPHPSDSTKMLFTVDIDTLPANTLSPVNAIIDPQTVKVDSALTTPSLGDRYLIINNGIGPGTQVWGDLEANANDIIEWDGSNWVVALDSASHNAVEYVTNLNTTVQYRFQNQQWVRSVEGLFKEGEWTIVI